MSGPGPVRPPFWMQVEQLLKDHTPSLSDENEEEMSEIFKKDWDIMDFADYALRTCSCGARIDGFYEYVDHLKDEAKKRFT
jgi:hypothetical protein